MRLGNIANKAKQQIDKRGGMDALKGDADELKGIAKSKGSLKDKAKAAGGALKEPGKAEEPSRARRGRTPSHDFHDFLLRGERNS